MGAGSSKPSPQLLPQPSKIYDLQFILAKPPPIISQSIQNVSKNEKQQAQNKQKLDAIKAKIIDYNKTWNFGNQSNGQPPQLLLEEKNYYDFIAFVTNLIQGKNTPKPLVTPMNANAKSFQDKQKDKQNIVTEIHELVSAGGNQLVNEPFKVGMSEIFPNMPGFKPDDTMMVTLLGLASIIGAEHIVIYLLMIGADPSIKKDNRDSATLMLSFQIGIYKLLQSNPQQQPQFLKYFIVLPRILYILFLLGSIGVGVDLSAIFETNEEKINENNSKKPKIPVKSSILNMLAQMPGNTSDETERQTLQNGGSIPLLLEILEKNNPDQLSKPKFFKGINSLETPYDLNVLYSVLLNLTIDDQTKIRLTELLVLKYNTNITNVPTFIEKRTNVDIFDRIKIAINDIKFTNPQTKLDILRIFSASNPAFKVKLESSGLLNNSNTNKNAKIKRLEAEVALLRQKSRLITNGLAGNLAKLGVQSSFINAQMDSLNGIIPTGFGTNQGVTQQGQQQSPGLAPQVQLQIQPTGFGTSPALSQQVLSQNLSTNLSQGKVIAQTGQPNQLQQKRGLFSGFFSRKPNNKQQIPPIQPNLTQNSKKGLLNSFKKLSLFGKKNNKGLTVAQPALLTSSQPISLQSSILNPTTSSASPQPVSPLNNPPNLALSSALSQSLVPLNPTTSSASLQPVSPLNNPPNLPISSALSQSLVPPNLPLSSASLQPKIPLITSQNSTSLLSAAQTNIKSKTSLKNRAKAIFGFGKKNQTGSQNTTPPLIGQTGGKQIQMRTYHFLKHKKYSERAFIAERPIIAADNAYDFMKLHYDIGSKKITFTIHDRVNNKKYKYTARTLKDGTNVIKSAK